MPGEFGPSYNPDEADKKPSPTNRLRRILTGLGLAASVGNSTEAMAKPQPTNPENQNRIVEPGNSQIGGGEIKAGGMNWSKGSPQSEGGKTEINPAQYLAEQDKKEGVLRNGIGIKDTLAEAFQAMAEKEVDVANTTIVLFLDGDPKSLDLITGPSNKSPLGLDLKIGSQVQDFLALSPAERRVREAEYKPLLAKALDDMDPSLTLKLFAAAGFKRFVIVPKEGGEEILKTYSIQQDPSKNYVFAPTIPAASIEFNKLPLAEGELAICVYPDSLVDQRLNNIGQVIGISETERVDKAKEKSQTDWLLGMASRIKQMYLNVIGEK